MPASSTAEVPHGFICGFPTQNGDLYSGSMYVSSAAETPQARAIVEANMIFGDGSIGQPTCKGKYQPFGEDGARRYACHLHDKERRNRVIAEGRFRGYEIDLEETFWNQCRDVKSDPDSGDA